MLVTVASLLVLPSVVSMVATAAGFHNYEYVARCYGRAFADSLVELPADVRERRIVEEAVRLAAAAKRSITIDVRTGMILRIK